MEARYLLIRMVAFKQLTVTVEFNEEKTET